MPQQFINIGAAPDDKTGDNPRAAGAKINSNFTELYSSSGNNVLLVSLVTTSVTLPLNIDVLEVNSSSATTITVPTNAAVAFPIGTQIEVFQVGTGVPTVVPASGVTFQPSTTASPAAQYRSVFLRKRATNTWAIA